MGSQMRFDFGNRIVKVAVETFGEDGGDEVDRGVGVGGWVQNEGVGWAGVVQGLIKIHSFDRKRVIIS